MNTIGYYLYDCIGHAEIVNKTEEEVLQIKLEHPDDPSYDLWEEKKIVK